VLIGPQSSPIPAAAKSGLTLNPVTAPSITEDRLNTQEISAHQTQPLMSGATGHIFMSRMRQAAFGPIALTGPFSQKKVLLTPRQMPGMSGATRHIFMSQMTLAAFGPIALTDPLLRKKGILIRRMSHGASGEMEIIFTLQISLAAFGPILLTGPPSRK